MIPRLKNLTKEFLTKTIWAYGPDEFVRQIRKCGFEAGDTLILHSSWQRYNGFCSKPADLIKALKTAVGSNGLLVMTSMPYHNMSSAEWLAKGKPMNVTRSPSMMGLVSEVFRRSEGVHRSLSATHPLLAWGKGAQDFISGHQDTDRPFGAESPFAELHQRNALILGFDAPFSTFTFTHFVEDHLADSLPIPLYEPDLAAGKVVDYDGNASTQWLRVISPLANKLRREERLIAQLERSQALHRGRIGNTTLVWIRAQALLTGAQKLADEGAHFFDRP